MADWQLSSVVASANPVVAAAPSGGAAKWKVATVAEAQASASGWTPRCGVPFAAGYRVIAHVYRHQSQELAASDLRALAGVPSQEGAIAGLGPRCGAALAAEYDSALRRRGLGGGPVLIALGALWRRALLETAALELLAAVLRIAAVLILGVVLRDLERGGAAAPSWLMDLIGTGVADSAALRVVALAIVASLARLARHWAGHVRRRLVAEAECALRAWAFRRAAASAEPGRLPALPSLLAESLPNLAAAFAKRSPFAALAHLLGAILAVVLLVHLLGFVGLIAVPTAGCTLALEAAFCSSLGVRWRAQAREARARRESVTRELIDALGAVKCFAWERIYFRRLGLLRSEEHQALRREARAAALAAALHPEVLFLLQGAACLGACAVTRGLADGGKGGDGAGLHLWQAFEALAACRVLGEQLRQLRSVILAPQTRALARPLEAFVSSLVAHAAPPRQGDFASYKGSKHAVTVEGMRFFWPDEKAEGDPGEGTVKILPGPSPVEEKRSAGKSNGLDMVDSVTDDASVAERARRAVQGVYRFDLKVLSFQVKRGALVALAGATGCGKSTLFSALIGRCQRELWGDDGEGNGVFLSGRIAYVPQKVTLLAGRTVRDNVLCGLPFEETKYSQALAMSTLSEDLAHLALGDSSDVADLGSEAARMCLQLARAIYCEAEIVLLDDPFVSLEKERASRVFTKCVKRLAKEKTVLLATQNLSILSEVELIVIIRNGTIFEQGDYKTLASMPTEFSRMLMIANQKEAARTRERAFLTNGVPCPFLSYEVDNDPMEDIFPQDKEYEMLGIQLAQDPKMSTLKTAQSDMWLSNRSIDMTAKGGGDQAATAPWDSQWTTTRDAGGVVVRNGNFATLESQNSARGKGAGKGKDQSKGSARGRPQNERQRLGGVSERRRGFAFGTPDAQEVQDFYDSQKAGEDAIHPLLNGADAEEYLNGLFTSKDVLDSRQQGPKSQGAAEPLRGNAQERRAGQGRGTSSAAPKLGGPGTFGGDAGIDAPEELRAPEGALGSQDDGGGVGRFFGSDGALPPPPLHGELEDGELQPASGGAFGRENSARPSSGGEPGPLPPQQRATRSVMPSSVGAYAPGATEPDFAQRPPRVFATPEETEENAVPEDQAIPKMGTSTQVANADDDAGTEALPPSPTSGDGLRRRLQPAGGVVDTESRREERGFQEEAAHASQPAPALDCEDVEATAARRPPLCPQASHTAPPPRGDKDEEKRRGRRGSKQRSEDPRMHRLDVLERALKEKNDKILELERQVADSARGERIPEPGSGAAAAALASALAVPESGEVLVPEAQGPRGTSIWMLFRWSGLSSLLLILIVVLVVGSHLALQYTLGNVLAGPTSTALVPAAAGSAEGGAAVAGITTSSASTDATAGSTTTGAIAGTIDADGVIWRGFAITTTVATTTSTLLGLPSTTTKPPLVLTAWDSGEAGNICKETGMSADSPGSGGYLKDPNFGWHWSAPIALDACKQKCEDSISWGCRFVSWGGISSMRWCYLHRSCVLESTSAAYSAFQLNVTYEPQERRLQVSADSDGVSSLLWRDDIYPHLSTLLAVLASFVVLITLIMVKVAARLALRASQEAAGEQLRVVLAASAPALAAAAGRLRAGLLSDVADADGDLPACLARLLAAVAPLAAAIVAVAVATGKQVLLSVALVVVFGLAAYLHAMRLPLLAQLRKLRTEMEAAAVLRATHLADCHEVLRAHGRLHGLCDEFEGLCGVLAQTAVARDVAERWLYTRLHCLAAALLGGIAFVLLTQAETIAADPSLLAVAAVALLQVALLPEPLAHAVKHGAVLYRGLTALRRMRLLGYELAAEELESPALRARLPSAREQREADRARAAFKARHGIVLGDSVIERGGEEEKAAALYDLARLEQEQGISVEGFPLERVADDWPYFGAVELESVTLRYAPGITAALQEASLKLPPAKALLVVGPEGSGKTSLLRALMRLSPTEDGRAVVDCVDVRSVGLTTLRSRVAFVPQDTALFRGSWHTNLDPTGEFTEEQILLVLRLTRLSNWLVRNVPKGLDENLPEDEAALQKLLDPAVRALIGLCRALLRLIQKRSKLLVLDRTTCNFSTSSDADLTGILLRFCRRREAAVLQVSRRVNQAPLYDEAAVLKAGRILEQGPPKKLWVRDGAFRKLAREQGVDSSKMAKPEAVSERLISVWNWEVSPQEDPAWSDEFAVNMKKVKTDKDRK